MILYNAEQQMSVKCYYKFNNFNLYGEYRRRKSEVGSPKSEVGRQVVKFSSAESLPRSAGWRRRGPGVGIWRQKTEEVN